jgi:hypothetical protein
MKRLLTYCLAFGVFAALSGCGDAPAESVKPDEALLKAAEAKGQAAPQKAQGGGGMPPPTASGLDPTK